MDRLLRLFAAGIVVVVVLIIAVKLMMRQDSQHPTVTVSAPVATPAPAAPQPEDPCGQSVILSVRSHAGVIAQMSVQDMDGQDLETNKGTDAEGQFTTECAKVDNEETSSDGSPGQVLRMCKPGTFVVHITGSGKGLFDFQAKALPDVAHPISPLLLCNYALDNDRTYDWVLKYQGGSKPAVFLIGSKGDANSHP